MSESYPVRTLREDDDGAYASCQVYRKPGQGWWCFGCQRGGRIYDLASPLSMGCWAGSCEARRSRLRATW